MMAATTDTINAAPPLYFILMWGWVHLFGNSALALRLPSAIALGVAMLIMFHVLRRVYGTLAATLAVAIAFAFCDPALLLQTTEARFHTLIVAEVALAILLYRRMMTWQGKVPFRLLAANAGIHACIVMTHYFGPLFSGAILAAVLLTSTAQRFNPSRAAASIVSGWTVFLFWIPVFLRHQAMGKPSSWIPIPDATSLRTYYGHYFTGDFWLLLAGLLLSLITGFAIALKYGRKIRPLFSRLFSVRYRELPLLMLLPSFGVIPLVVYFISTRPGGDSGFLDRYMHSVTLAWAILCAHLSHRAFFTGALNRRLLLTKVLNIAQATVIVVAIGWGGWALLQHGLKAKTENPSEDLLVDTLGSERIVVEHLHEFLKRNFYSAQPYRYLFVVDHEVGLKEGGGGPLNHQIMAGLKRNFPKAFTGVISNEEFLSGTTSFWVKRSDMLWWRFRIEHNPLFASEVGEDNLVHVERLAPPE